MEKHMQLILQLRDQRGVTIILIALLMVSFIGVAAFAIDFGHLYVVRNELQNAADAGALAGARYLYINNGTTINVGANQIAYDAATVNKSEKAPVEVNWQPGGNTGTDVERGHWSFGMGSLPKGFYPNDSLLPPQLWDLTTVELDESTDFINAVKVKTRRESTPAASFFARIFGYQSFPVNAEAVAYIGFAGTLTPQGVDQPIAICKQAILDANGKYTCGVGRMINSGANIGHQTGGWTNFAQPCTTANVPSVRPLVCGTGNPEPIDLGQGIGTVGGMEQTIYDQLIGCWKNVGLDTNGDGWPDRPWKLTLPVIDCQGNNVGPCSAVVGAVELQVVWITRTDKNQMNEVPKVMGGVNGYPDWTCPPGDPPQQCWDGFVQNFQLKDVLNNSPAIYEDKTIYFIPDCTPHDPEGTTGGENFGILAEIPKLVK
jgi:hypothetical protein